MSWMKPLASLGLALTLTAPTTAQHAQTSCVAPRPGVPSEVWTCNRDNNSVSVIDLTTGTTVAEIPVGNHPRSLAFSSDGSRVFVACQRGNVAFNKTFVTPFDGSEIRGQVSVIDAGARAITGTMNAVGIEPFGLAVAPNGAYFAVTGFRSGSVKFFNTQSLAQVASYDYLADTNLIPPPFTIADVDSNRDGMADLGEPRGFVIRSDSARIYVTHNRSPFISVLDVTLDPNGLPIAVALDKKIDTNQYPFDPYYNPNLVQTIASQGLPRFQEDIALSPDGSRALVPHLLHNINHDVNHDFGPGLAGAFANRVYPALTAIDAVNDTFGAPGDSSLRLHNELSDPNAPAEFYPFGTATPNGGGLATLGATGQPTVPGQITFVIDGLQPGQAAQLWLGRESFLDLGPIGEQLVKKRVILPIGPSGQVTFGLPNNPSLTTTQIIAQAAFFNTSTGVLERLTNGLKVNPEVIGAGMNKLGHRAGHPSRVTWSPDGSVALMLNRGSEDIFLYRVSGGAFRLNSVYPPRRDFTPRAPLDMTTGMGDLPLGMALLPDASTSNDDARLFVMNEATRTLSVLRVDFKTGTIHKDFGQIPTLLGPDQFSTSVRQGEEIFEDSSRPQTAGNFNNSCASCHFEGGEDGNIWQRGAGPRATMPVYGGTLLTGTVLWKGVRLNMGETGPMFGGENGGTGIFTDAEQQSLIDYHETIPVPLNPNFNLVTGQYTRLAALGKDLYFGTNDTGLNPTVRNAGCAACHPDSDQAGTSARGYTTDFLDPMLTMGENLETFDPFCFNLQENFLGLNLRNVNSGCDIDFDQDGLPDPDRNFDGYVDVETYPIMNPDTDDDFTRDDGNSYDCPQDPSDPQSPLKFFGRGMRMFSVPTKLGVFSSGPYFHDHSAYSLRMVLDPEAQAVDPVYGTPAYGGGASYPGLVKFFNEFHDVRGHEQFVQGASKVQVSLQSTDVNADIEALLAYIQSL